LSELTHALVKRASSLGTGSEGKAPLTPGRVPGSDDGVDGSRADLPVAIR
jgi:hypothetical protein